jgi:hypothetical protein
VTVDESGNLFTFTLVFRGFEVDPAVISSALDLSPNHVSRTGERTTLKDGTVLRYASRLNDWSYQEEHHGESNFDFGGRRYDGDMTMATFVTFAHEPEPPRNA